MHCVFFQMYYFVAVGRQHLTLNTFWTITSITYCDRIEHVEALGLSGRLSVWSDLLVVGF